MPKIFQLGKQKVFAASDGQKPLSRSMTNMLELFLIASFLFMFFIVLLT
jgi:hypothetical protein